MNTWFAGGSSKYPSGQSAFSTYSHFAHQQQQQQLKDHGYPPAAAAHQQKEHGGSATGSGSYPAQYQRLPPQQQARPQPSVRGKQARL